MAGVPSIMQAMPDEVAPKLKIGVHLLSETVRAASTIKERVSLALSRRKQGFESPRERQQNQAQAR